jgi:hypothetical protein
MEKMLRVLKREVHEAMNFSLLAAARTNCKPHE